MKRFSLIALLLFIFIGFSYSQAVKKVLIIGIDGCRTDALQLANTPNIDQLITNGIYSPDMMNTDVTSSGPGWSAILTGVWSDKHGVTSNDFNSSNFEEYPPLMKYANDFSSDMHTVSIVHWGPINTEIIQDNADFSFIFPTDEEVKNTATNYLELNDPDFMFIHFDAVDHTGHLSGFSPSNPDYIAAIEGVDALIAPLVDAIANRPTYSNEDWLILVTTDHGGKGNSHGGASFGEQHVFVVASGNSIPNTLILADSSLVQTEDCLNNSFSLFFDGNDDFVEVPENSLYNFGADQDFTVECRIKTQEAADVAIVGNKNWTTGINPGFVFSFSGGTWKVNIGDGSNREDINGGVVSDNEWHTLSVTFDRDGEMKMYEDGVFVTSTSISTIGDINTGEGLFFGTDINSDYDYTGSIVEVRVWDSVLSDATIQAWSCDSVNAQHPNYNNLIGYWKMNNPSEGMVVDYSNSSNDGQIHDAVWTNLFEEWEYDYSNTPRPVDISITALTHLCIPILDEWDLDGESLIDECVPTGIENDFVRSKFAIYPIPVESTLFFALDGITQSEPIEIEIYSSTGELIYQAKNDYNEQGIDVSFLKNGLYLLKVNHRGSSFAARFIKN